MNEETSLMTKPKKIWNDALKMVKGEDSTQLIEQFTAEMTLVAEGLCEDQNQLRGEVNRLMNEEERRLQKQGAQVDHLETLLEEQQRENDRVITELRNRLSVLEKQKNRDERSSEKKQKNKERNRIRDLTWLIIVTAAAVIAVVLVVKLV